jgi:putative Ca2+/H+ antiporter (TMEM165/GDT1 family)
MSLVEGDKSQLMAMTFAARYRARDVLIGITVATAVVHLASVGVAARSAACPDVCAGLVAPPFACPVVSGVVGSSS